MRLIQKLLAGALLVGLTQMAYAEGGYTLRQFGDGQINIFKSGLISDLVTQKYASKYPPSKYQIVFIADVIHYGPGGGVTAIANAWVTQNAGKEYPRVNKHMFVVAKTQESSPSKFEEIEMEKLVVRAVTSKMMDACQSSPTCELME
jgi:hypothetical protein